jgi:hypothetical protein
MGRRIELGAGLAAGALALLALALLLFAPLVPACAGSHACPGTNARYVSLLQARLAPDAWALVLTPALLTLVGAAGAIADARYGIRAGIVPLGVAAGLGLLLCLLGAAGLVGVVYFPTILALALATYGAFLDRSAARPAATSTGADDTQGS